MAHYVLKNCGLWVAEYAIASDTSDVTLDYTAEEKDNTCFGASGRARLAGLTDVKMSASGFFQGDNENEALGDHSSFAMVPITICPKDTDVDDVAYFFQGMKASYDFGGAVGEVAGWNAIANAEDAPLVNGYVIYNGTVANGTTNSDAIQLGAVTAGHAIYGTLHLTAETSLTTLAVVVQSSTTEGGSYTTRGNFSVMTGLDSDFFTDTDTETDTWWRVQVIQSGTSSTILCTLGIL